MAMLGGRNRGVSAAAHNRGAVITKVGAVAAVAAALALSAAPGSAAASAGASAPPFCDASGPISATALPATVDLATCPIQGREIVMALKSGEQGVGVPVPAPGQTVGNDTLTTSGNYSLAVATDSNGVVTVTEASPLAPVASAARDSTGLGHPSRHHRRHHSGPAAFVSEDSACSESAYNLNGGHWNSTDNWYYNSSTEGSGIGDGIGDLRAGINNMVNGINNCGLTENAWSASGAYQGDTSSKYANVDAAGNCTSIFPNGQNTDSWENFTNGSTLAVTCWRFNGSGVMTEADTAYAKDAGLVSTLPSGCTSYYDLESVSTHEWGHVYGMAHETAGNDEVMYPYTFLCALRRHLGKGDHMGMASLYG